MATKRMNKIIYNVIVIMLLIISLIYIISRFVHLGNVEYTNNAQVKQHITHINNRLPGFIKKICFTEYSQVHKGDTLLIIEDTEFRLRLAQAEADLVSAQSGELATSTLIETTTNDLYVNDASITQARVQMENNKRDLERYEELLKKGAATRQQYDNVKTAYETAKARFEQVSHVKRSTSLVKDQQKHQLKQSESRIKLAQLAVELAKLNLSYTVITAPCDGMTGEKNITEGQLVQPGQNMLDIIDKDEIWVIANYRETQLSNIKEGAQVCIKADAVKGKLFKGVVTSISKATGTTFSPIHQDNATGNFVKVEQRVPVRIDLVGNSQSDVDMLRAGFNVECKIEY